MQSLSDPAGSNVLVAAVTWLQATLLGTAATTLAIIAVASVGYGMLAGRINWSRGATVILGCFILFGASSIVAGIQSSIGTTEAALPEQPHWPTVRALPASDSLHNPPPAPADPFAGASVPS